MGDFPITYIQQFVYFVPINLEELISMKLKWDPQ